MMGVSISASVREDSENKVFTEAAFGQMRFGIAAIEEMQLGCHEASARE